MKKPPLGVMPKYIHDEMRRQDLAGAITRYIEDGAMVHPEWVEEYNELTKRKKEEERHGHLYPVPAPGCRH